ncbi:interleukin-23 receptor isoform X3 [Centroberyx affinis]|uniref:interleukin-23 receptor isoform X3 n=1 Tax=Centroberyx affinis TaxID=166261 RepID=UPI003A5C4C3F
MNLFQTIWRCTIIFLLNFSRHCPLLPAGCQLTVNCLGYLTVEPDPLFLIGSDLTVYCHTTKCDRSFRFSLQVNVNGPTVPPEEKVNCTTVRFRLTNVRKPKTTVTCKQRAGVQTQTVCGLDLHGGLSPDKPTDISCETSRNSNVIDCSWNRGQETHLRTTYNISVTRKNGTQVHSDWIRDTGEFTMPRTVLDENEIYQLIVTAGNHFGASKSDPFILCVKDIVIPETPHIMQIEFWNNSIAAMLHWRSPESSDRLRFFIRLSTDNASWVEGEATELSKGLIRVDDLKPLTEYEFQIRACNSTSGLTPTKRSTSSKRPLCSKWSPSFRRRIPGKGPSQQLHVWRMLHAQETNGLRTVTVLWKPPSPEDYSGEVQQYEIFLDNSPKQRVTCPAAVNQCSVQVSPGVQALSVSAVTSYGKSPPAAVPLRHLGVSGLALWELAPAGDGNVVVVSWSSPASGGQLLDYVVEWTSGVAGLHWQRVAKDQNTTLITGLTAGVRYNVSLYAVTTRGVSDPSSGLVYSKEQKPVSGPNVSVLVYEAKRILIQWEELAVDQQRGFITNYTIYLQNSLMVICLSPVTVSGSGPRQMWLDCPEGSLAVWLSASTSAGEGPPGNLISSQPVDPADPAYGLLVGFVVTATLFIAIIANLMCWSCVRKRLKQKCISLGPAWLAEKLPKLRNSNAIKLLQDSAFEIFSSCSYSDPPLSPIEISQEEREDLYPVIHIEGAQTRSGQATAEATLQTADAGTVLLDGRLEHVSYKPQIAASALQEEEEEEEQRDVAAGEQGDRCSVISGGFLGGLLSNVEVNFPNSPLGLTFGSVRGLLAPKTAETTSIFSRDFLLGESGIETEVEIGTTSLDLLQGEIMTADEADMSPYMVETILTNGYFPQEAALDNAHN